MAGILASTKMEKTEPGYLVRFLGASLALALCLLLVRSRLIHFLSLHGLPQDIKLPLLAGLAGYYDFVYVAALTAVFLALTAIARRNQTVQRMIYAVFVVVGVFSLLLAMANVRIVAIFGSPLTYSWLYYSDFLRGQDARNAIVEALTVKRLLLGAAMVALFLASSRILAFGLRAAIRRVGARALAAIAIPLLLLYFPIAGARVRRSGWREHKLKNPVVAFVRSMVVAGRSPSLLTMPTSFGSQDFEPLAAEPERSSRAPRGGDPVRNVLIVVLESVAAEYLQPYGGRYPVTPTLQTLQSRAALFESIYTPAPYTTSSLAALLLSIYPSVVQKDFIKENPSVSFPSLSSVLQARGYRTAYFGSADARFLNTGAFLSHHGFDVVRDYRSVPCSGALLRASTPNWPLLDGIDDECTADALVGWIAEAPERPFFAVFWTMMTHYPYFASEPASDFGVHNAYFNRYLNALQHDDLVIAKVMRSLEERGLDRSTLVAVVGDHGEAFGRHGYSSHGTNVYEENVHVPLLLIQPNRFHGERYPDVGGIIDLAPTILDLLDIPPPRLWQGRSLWSPTRTGRAYFASWLSDFRLGYREGNRKIIYHAGDNRFEVFDLLHDPVEATNLAAHEPATIVAAKERLAAWVQYQDRMMRSLFSKEPRSAPEDPASRPPEPRR
jgi:lipoteichoic acid synthase